MEKPVTLPRNTTSSKYQYYRRDNAVLLVLRYFSSRQYFSTWVSGRRRRLHVILYNLMLFYCYNAKLRCFLGMTSETTEVGHRARENAFMNLDIPPALLVTCERFLLCNSGFLSRYFARHHKKGDFHN
jgi:hypothetical protein